MFEFLINTFNVLLYYPLFNALVLIYNFLPNRDFGLAIIILTLAIRALLYPITAKAVSSQNALQKLQPLMKEIQKKHKNDKEKQAREMMELYRKEKINPFGGLFLTLIQLPILIALYNVFWKGFKTDSFGILYGFVANPGQINASFLGFADLSQPNIFFAVVAGIIQFFQTKMLLPTQSADRNGEKDISSLMQKQMVYFFPILTIVILFRLPSALGLYWIASGAFSIIQQYLILQKEKRKSKEKTSVKTA